MPRTQRGGRDINRGTGVTQSRSSIYLILNWLSTTNCPPPCRSRKKGGDESDPPRNGGLLRPRIAARCPTPLSGPMRGRYRPYLSLREGSEPDRSERRRRWCGCPLFPLPWKIPDRSSPSRVRSAASRPGLLRADPKGWRFTRERGGGVSGRKGPFGHTSVLSRSGGVGFTRRAVAERRSRESGLTCPGAEAIRDLVFRVLSLQGMAF